MVTSIQVNRSTAHIKPLIVYGLQSVLVFSLSIIGRIDLLLYMAFVWLLVFVLQLGLYVRHKKQEPLELKLVEGQLILCEKKLAADSISEIRVKGYFKPLIGIKVKGRTIVPVGLSFNIVGDEDRAMRSLRNWAADNQVQVLNKDFMRWM